MKTEIKVLFKGGGHLFIMCDKFTATWDSDGGRYTSVSVEGAARPFGFDPQQMVAWQEM